MTDAVEREVKLAADPDLVVPDLGEDGALVVTALDPHELDATYYDAADRRLLDAGITVRRRSGEAGVRWTVKFPTDESAAAGGVARREVDLMTDVVEPPGALVDLVEPTLRGADLIAVARLVSHRERLALATPGGHPVAEVDDDRVTVLRPATGGAADAAPGAPLGFREIEVEFEGDADPAAVGRVVERLLAAGARPSAGRSKVWLALGLLDGQDGPRG